MSDNLALGTSAGRRHADLLSKVRKFAHYIIAVIGALVLGHHAGHAHANYRPCPR
jgi:hypothetical protein